MWDSTATRIAILSLALGAVMLGAMLVTTGGRFVLPLDDPYIYFQYATQNVRGELFRYNDGDPPTTGASSLLYLVLLTPLAVVFRGTSLAVVSFLAGLVFFFLMLRSVHRIAAGWMGPGSAWPVTALTATCGPLLWGVYSGMETPLVAWLAARVVEELGWLGRIGHAERDGQEGTPFSRPRFVAMASLLALARPEAAIVVVALVVTIIALRREAGPLRTTGVWIPLVAAAVPYAVNLGLTGSVESTTLASKGAPYLPGTNPGVWAIESAQFFLHNLKAIFASGDAESPAWPSAYGTLVAFAAPLTLPFLVVGLFPAVVEELRARRPGAALAGGYLLWGALVFWAALVPINLHWNRYLLPYLPLVWLFVVAGVHRLAAAFERPGARDALRTGLLGFFFACALPILIYFVAIYGWNCREIGDQHVAMATWLRARAPRGAWIGTNDVGAIRFYGDRPVLDLHGLTSRDFAACKQAGTGAIYEKLESLPAAKRPAVFVLLPGWYDPAFGGMHRPIRSQTLRRPMIAGSPLVAYEADWSLAGLGDTPGPNVIQRIQGHRLVDRVDVADLSSEAAHDYRLRLLPGVSASPLAVLSSPGSEAPIPDGGRLVTLREEMSVSLLPGVDAVLVMRALGGVQARVSVDGSDPIPLSARPAGPGEGWIEAAVRLPGPAIRRSPAHLRVEAEGGAYEEGGYTSFHYWFYQ